MSTFCGFIDEIPGISVDNFESYNCSTSRLFFLTHCHFDHMKGLNVHTKLPGVLYMSPISEKIVNKLFPCIKTISLDIGVPLSIQLDGSPTEDLVVTTIPAGHCIGSVMFLFEFRNNKILYTGDFRISTESLKDIKLLKSESIDKVYFDSTFLIDRYEQFPTQEESINEICGLIQNWIELNESNKVFIRTSARYGSESLFVEIYRRLKIPVHLTKEDIEYYKAIPNLDNCLTCDTNNRVHACLNRRNISHSLCLPKENKKFALIIRISAIKWSNWKIKSEIFVKSIQNNYTVFNVCLSNHCSCSELRNFLLHLKCKVIYAIASSPNQRDHENMMEILNNFKESFGTSQNITMKVKQPISINLPNVLKNIDRIRKKRKIVLS